MRLHRSSTSAISTLFSGFLPAFFSLSLLSLVAGCASTTPGGGSVHDLALGAGDLAGATLDLATPSGGDLANAVDLAPLLQSDGGAIDLAGSDLTPPDDLVFVGKVSGEACDQDADCQSMLCKGVLAGSAQKICVSPCKAQPDCAMFFNAFCEAISAGSANGYCVPHSPAHCTSCQSDSDCGGLAERCIKAPSDIALACHVDCALAGASACPPDYNCAQVPDGNVMRQLCVPKTGVCLDAIGGYCDRVNLPQPCARTNGAGSCTGQRQCLQNSGRFDKCGAQAPQFKMTCLDMDPAGCMEQYSQGAISTKSDCGACGKACGQLEDCCGMACTPLNTPQNCGACGKVCNNGEDCCGGVCTAVNTPESCGGCGKSCPGLGQQGADVACANLACTFACRGENYDVNNNSADGCERNNANPPGHTEGGASSQGVVTSCDFGNYTNTFTGQLLSDTRVHQNPSITGFDANIGSAPDWWTAVGKGQFGCQNDYRVEFTTSGGGNGNCYRCTILLGKGGGFNMNSVTVSGAGSATMSAGSGSYDDGATIYFKIEKICSAQQVQEAVSYTVKYHL